MGKQKEQRAILEPVKLDLRQEGDKNTPVIQGYAALFDVQTEIYSRYGLFKESIAPGAFKDTLASGKRVVSLFNHDQNYVLGSTTSGTMRVMEDMRGLWLEVDPPDTQVGRDVVEYIRRGDVQGQSFMFTITAEEWKFAQSKDEIDERRILGIELFEAGPVLWPAYEQTNVGLRSSTDAAYERARKEWEDRNRSEEPIITIVHPEPYLLRARVIKASLPLARS